MLEVSLALSPNLGVFIWCEAFLQDLCLLTKVFTLLSSSFDLVFGAHVPQLFQVGFVELVLGPGLFQILFGCSSGFV